MMTDIEIAQNAKMLPIVKIAEKLNIPAEELELYGNYKCKISENFYNKVQNNKNGKLILVTAINPTPAGEGKTTTSVGLAQSMNKIGKNACLALREPSLGPVFGIKGGAAGGGYSQVVPMEDINLHFTGDMHAISAANNLLCAAIDNHLQQGNLLDIDVRRIIFKRVVDMNDRALRFIIIGLGGKMNSFPREDGFMITVASEVMAILCLADDINDLKNRLGNILVAYTRSGDPVYAHDIKVEGAMAALLKDAVKPNLVQTLENTPCFMHGGPFANIAHGCNSIRATKLALKTADYCITEAGFGADLGAEKFLDIKCRSTGLTPDCVVLVATVRALKYNGGAAKTDLQTENVSALEKGLCNLGAHIANMQKFGLRVVVAINHFYTDSEKETECIRKYCDNVNVPCSFSNIFLKGGDGGIDLAEKVAAICDEPSPTLKFIYDTNDSIKNKISAIAKNIYGADNVIYTKKADNDIKDIESLGKDRLPICMAKTQYSLSDNPQLLGRPSGFDITVREVRLSSGAGFIVAMSGDIMTMPGLPKIPAANNIDIDSNGKISGLF